MATYRFRYLPGSPMPTLMRDDIVVETGSGVDDTGAAIYQATINDRKANRCWSGSGKTVGEAATEATRKFLGDRRAKEYVE